MSLSRQMYIHIYIYMYPGRERLCISLDMLRERERERERESLDTDACKRSAHMIQFAKIASRAYTQEGAEGRQVRIARLVLGREKLEAH